MSTQAIVSIMKNNHTFIKAICGCNGFNAEKLAGIIKDIRPEKIKDVYDLALKNKFGCKDCLVVMNSDDIMFKGDGYVSPLYRKTFNDPLFNPRWNYGTADHIIILEVKNSGDVKVIRKC